MIRRMSLPENALNVPNFDLATVETLLTPTRLWTCSAPKKGNQMASDKYKKESCESRD